MTDFQISTALVRFVGFEAGIAGFEQLLGGAVFDDRAADGAAAASSAGAWALARLRPSDEQQAERRKRRSDYA